MSLVISGKNVLIDGVFQPATLTIEDGVIVTLTEELSSQPEVIHAGARYVIPGLIELHTDNHEKYFEPRPGVHWPHMDALIAHDAQLATAGITTVFDAIALGYGVGASNANRERIAAESINTLLDIRHQGVFRVDHHIHLRCECSCEGTDAYFAPWAGVDGIDLVSLMDHAPGQRQFASIDKYIEYYKKKYGYTDDALKQVMDEHTKASNAFSNLNRQAIAALCAEHQIALASHDDATLKHVEESVSLGCSLAEFPTTLEAGEACHKQGLLVMMGAPNVIRGGSHSGNVAAKDFAARGWLDVLSSDYYPTALLPAAVKLTDPEIGMSLGDAIATVTSNPAKAARLSDRGHLAEGLRGDIVLFSLDQHGVRVAETYVQGHRVF
ncbi:MAG TPA: phosphonate metabolism protein PhnM [Gammaproteobacteria bacterium]|jgi:alpha-D-ribose 1-methylphosphonate 5-triphosphate diphosphatase|nr:alpha-D-ribose 1-methylphosphonate 5-triphosphate diphosphatase [Litorivicinus sp.]HBC49445.1 phosphonate metabolism protein PhnM [Gammaproteobacteria bacterium]HBZ91101.1 phosphonate metabolism protein PhnM [Gammaproteobacteria bacterium]